MADTIVLFLLFESLVVYVCTASYVHTLYQNVPEVLESQRTRCARKSNDLQYCGTRINSSNFSTEPLIAKDWCDVGTRELGYIYMLKKEVIVTRIPSWGFGSQIPVCAEIESTIEIQLTPRTGWNTIAIKLFRQDWNTTLHLTIDQTSGTLVENVLASLTIKVQVDSFQTYLNGNEFEKVLYTAGIPYYPIYLQVHPAPADIHQVIYRAAPGQTP